MSYIIRQGRVLLLLCYPVKKKWPRSSKLNQFIVHDFRHRPLMAELVTIIPAIYHVVECPVIYYLSRPILLLSNWQQFIYNDQPAVNKYLLKLYTYYNKTGFCVAIFAMTVHIKNAFISWIPQKCLNQRSPGIILIRSTLRMVTIFL